MTSSLRSRVHAALHGSVVGSRRARVLAARLAELIPQGASVLDVGCGDGEIDALLLQHRPDISIEGIDVLQRPQAHIPVRGFDGDHIPHPDASFDVVMFIDVLHHTTNPSILLAEAARVARQAVVLKDHLREGLLAGPVLRAMDWFGNAAHGVALPYNYWTRQQWQSAFTALRLHPDILNSKLGLYPFPASLLFERGLHVLARLRLG